MYLFFPLALSTLLLLVTTWIGWRYFSKKTYKIQDIKENSTINHSTKTVRKRENTLRKRPPSRALHAYTIKIDEATRKLIAISAWPILSILLISTTLIAVLFFNENHKIENLTPKEYAYGAKIKLTLEEELLVPPPPLPPEAFVDVIMERPSLNTANRDWALLDAAFVQKVLHIMEKLKARGYPMTLLEGYRSPERQNALAGQATLVTKAKGGQSKHQYGLAVDLAPVRNGKVVISEKDPWALEAYQALGEEAHAASLTWGGVWRFRDYGHIEKSGPLHKPQGR